MDSSLQLHQIFPPSFRDLWLSWANEKRDEKNQAQKELDDAKQRRIDHLVSLIANLQVKQKLTQKETLDKDVKNNSKDDSDDDGAIAENWDDDDDDDDADDLPVQSNISTTVLGKKLQRNFVEIRKTTSYQRMKAARDSLPMSSYRQTVLDTVRDNPVTILCAETGAGKTTQAPQYILEEALLDGHGDKVQILCTQPRRVAATSVAERVSEEMCDTLGQVVGYQIRMEAKRSSHTKLLFCTTGIVLRRLQEDSDLSGITHVLVDEVHERQQQTDVLLVILRQLLETTRPDLKVILMSATMDSDLFCSFFHGAPLISVPGRTFPVNNYYLEDLLDATDHVIEEGSRYALRDNNYGEKESLYVTTRGGEKRKEVVDLYSQTDPLEVSSTYSEYKMSTRRSMERVNEEVINFDLIEDVLLLLLIRPENNNTLVAPDGADLSTGSILVFLPGLGEIKAMAERLEGNRHFRDASRFEIIPMHSTLSSRDQRRAFIPAKTGCRKIILSTNICETSVTVPSVVCVLDTGKVREVRQNKRTLTSVLATDWCSKASAKQRAGRAGRVQSGLCLKLYSSHTAKVMKAASLPELQRVPLEEICLSILASGFAKSCLSFLSQAPEPPSEQSIRAAIDVLHDVGAIERSEEKGTTQHDQLTPLGQHLAKLPVDCRLGKMLIFSTLFQCVDPVLTITACLSSQSPFSNFVNDAAVAKAKQQSFADPDSDFMTYCNLWEAYSKALEESHSAVRQFCRDNYLSQAALREISDARRQFLGLLQSIGFLGDLVKGEKLKTSVFNKHARKQELVNSVICAGLIPNVAHLEQRQMAEYIMWHNTERLYFHKASVNASKKRFSSSENWVVFHEKFGESLPFD